jgi:hypothetical protein
MLSFFATLSGVEIGIPIWIMLHQSPTDCAAISYHRYFKLEYIDTCMEVKSIKLAFWKIKI